MLLLCFIGLCMGESLHVDTESHAKLLSLRGLLGEGERTWSDPVQCRLSPAVRLKLNLGLDSDLVPPGMLPLVLVGDLVPALLSVSERFAGDDWSRLTGEVGFNRFSDALDNCAGDNHCGSNAARSQRGSNDA